MLVAIGCLRHSRKFALVHITEFPQRQVIATSMIEGLTVEGVHRCRPQYTCVNRLHGQHRSFHDNVRRALLL